MRRSFMLMATLACTFAYTPVSFAADEVQLAYKLKAGDVLRSKVTHQVTVDTKVKGVAQLVNTKSVSCKTWKVEKIDAQGNATFVHLVEWVDLWNQVSDRPETKYDSRVDDKAPPGFENVSLSIGEPLATITINRAGRVVNRKDVRPQFNPGIGDLTVPLPEKPIAIGGKWHVDEEVKLSDEQKRVKTVQVRHQYVLEKFENGVATIGVRTVSLTPIDDPRFQAQLVQRMQSGTIRFDADAGRILSRQMDLDETVLSFSGADSSMHYVARYTEEPLEERAAVKAGKSKQK
jgi:hypothetical protein